MESLYPMMLDLKGKKCLVIGGGNVALRKVRTLLGKQAEVKLVSPRLCEELIFLQDNLKHKSYLNLIKKKYETKDLDEACLVFACTDDKSLNANIASEAKERGLLVNCVSPPEESTFIVPATVSKGNLTISVSTGGASPALSRKIKEKIESEFSSGWDNYIELLWFCRQNLQKKVESEEKRKKIYYEILDDDSIFEKAKELNKSNLKKFSKDIIDKFTGVI